MWTYTAEENDFISRIKDVGSFAKRAMEMAGELAEMQVATTKRSFEFANKYSGNSLEMFRNAFENGTKEYLKLWNR